MITFAGWALVLNLPGVGVWVTFNRLWSTAVFLAWASIPGWLVGRWVEERHFADNDIGVVPVTPLAWSLVIGFWILVAFGLTLVSVVRCRGLSGRSGRRTGNQKAPNK